MIVRTATTSSAVHFSTLKTNTLSRCWRTQDVRWRSGTISTEYRALHRAAAPSRSPKCTIRLFSTFLRSSTTAWLIFTFSLLMAVPLKFISWVGPRPHHDSLVSVLRLLIFRWFFELRILYVFLSFPYSNVFPSLQTCSYSWCICSSKSKFVFVRRCRENYP